MAPVPQLDLRAQYAALRGRLREAMERVAESQTFILGPEVEALEREIAAYCGCRHAIGCSSGTDAILLTLMAAGIKRGDEVIVPTYTFFATAGCVARLGAKPVFADVDPRSLNILPSEVERLATRKTKAVIPVHLYGQCAEMKPIMELARKKKFVVIEDACQAIGAECDGKRAGAIGHAGCFSFYPTKNLGGFGEGGMVTTNDDALAEKMRMLRAHGSREAYHHEEVGGNFRLDAIQAAVLRVKLEYLDRWTAARQENAARYNRLFEEAGAVMARGPSCMGKGCGKPDDCSLIGSDKILLPVESPAAGRYATRMAKAPFAAHRHVYNQYVIRTGCRDEVIASLKKSKVGYNIYYPIPLHLQKCFAKLGGKAGDFPASECAARTSLALPMYPELTEAQQKEVVQAVVRGLRGQS